MSKVDTTFLFPATAESVITWGRSLTDTESALVQSKKGAMFAAGNFGSFPATVNGVSTFAWVSSDAANEFVAFCNTFTPPPESAVVNSL